MEEKISPGKGNRALTLGDKGEIGVRGLNGEGDV